MKWKLRTRRSKDMNNWSRVVCNHEITESLVAWSTQNSASSLFLLSTTTEMKTQTHLQHIWSICDQIDHNYKIQSSMRVKANEIFLSYVTCTEPKKATEILKKRERKVSQIQNINSQIITLSSQLADDLYLPTQNTNENTTFNINKLFWDSASQNLQLAI